MGGCTTLVGLVGLVCLVGLVGLVGLVSGPGTRGMMMSLVTAGVAEEAGQ
jgi:hypothetical protein